MSIIGMVVRFCAAAVTGILAMATAIILREAINRKKEKEICHRCQYLLCENHKGDLGSRYICSVRGGHDSVPVYCKNYAPRKGEKE